uniref:Putative secreted protein n=1 Tax=Anopheles darlingi TaxID=43151 RepID=A0A2M4DKZ5_ANODA
MFQWTTLTLDSLLYIRFTFCFRFNKSTKSSLARIVCIPSTRSLNPHMAPPFDRSWTKSVLWHNNNSTII